MLEKAKHDLQLKVCKTLETSLATFIKISLQNIH
jgi:hypothetical protein